MAIKSNFRSLILNKGVQQNKQVVLKHAAREMGIGYTAFLRLYHDNFKSVRKNDLIKALRYLECSIGDLLSFSPDPGNEDNPSAPIPTERVTYPDCELTIKSNLAQQIRRQSLKENKNLSLVDISNLSGVSTTVIRYWVNDQLEHFINRDQIDRLVKALDCKVDDLLLIEPVNPDDEKPTYQNGEGYITPPIQDNNFPLTIPAGLMTRP